jgi:hypothetical protein
MINSGNNPKINNHMDQTSEKEQPQTAEKPNESTGIYVRGHLRISDPESGQVILETGN